MAKKSKQEIMLTPSGHEVDKDLMRVPVKVSPSLQALIANQMDLMDMIQGKAPADPVWLEQHRTETLQVEEEIASAFSAYMQKREKAKERRLLKKAQENEAAQGEQFTPSVEKGMVSAPEGEPQDSFPAPESFPVSQTVTPMEGKKETEYDFSAGFNKTPEKDMPDVKEINGDFGFIPDTPSTGLPSAKYETRTRPAPKKEETDIRRVALGASIKALQNFLGRELTEEEMRSVEAQVDSFLG